MLLLIYTGCRPAELVDAAKRKATAGEQAYEDDNWNSAYQDSTEIEDDDPLYENVKPWTNPNNTDYNDENTDDISTREYKALCFEDIRVWIVRNPTLGERDLLGMEILLANHKGADRKPKPYIF